ncbi:hypothetical protein LMANV2_170056 [Leptospira interrogans serovar Manilae]|uniref:Uncharacterized protein n=1 Tax=Leptospira interrogans serovar Manilae TaxID=214675 RepID=A0AAQ1SMN9_LEPIR|nr:hypothetical protein LMANV2_170056 [Leptospira interrogans serovar Manilae]
MNCFWCGFATMIFEKSAISLFKKLKCRISLKEVINSVWGSGNP